MEDEKKNLAECIASFLLLVQSSRTRLYAARESRDTFERLYVAGFTPFLAQCDSLTVKEYRELFKRAVYLSN